MRRVVVGAVDGSLRRRARRNIERGTRKKPMNTNTSNRSPPAWIYHIYSCFRGDEASTSQQHRVGRRSCTISLYSGLVDSRMLRCAAARGGPCTPVRYACPSPCNTASAFAATALLQFSFRTRCFSEPKSHSCRESVAGQPVVGQPVRRTPSPQRGRQTTIRSNAHPRPPPVSMRVVSSRVSTRGARLDRPRGRLGRGRARNKSGDDSKTRCACA